MSLEWLSTHNPSGEWNWYCHLPNGWTAIVSDISQVAMPEDQPTFYLVSASSKECSITLQADDRPMAYDWLYDARRAAILLASEQAMPLEMTGLLDDDEEDPGPRCEGLEALHPPPDEDEDGA